MKPAIMSRRHLLAAAAAAPLTSLVGEEAMSASPSVETTYVLVHGAWHGGWCWKKLVPLLRAAGHHVLTPTLTGLGERSHLLNADVDLDTHVRDILGVLEADDLSRVVLVGHSYGGMVVSAVAERNPSRIARLVYVDAFLPDQGKSLSDYAPVPPARADGWRVPPPGSPQSWGVTDASDIAWMTPRLGDQPVKTFTQAVQRDHVQLSASSQTFVRCSRAPFFVEAGARAKQRGFAYDELLSAGHDAMISAPAALAKILLDVRPG